MGRFLPLAKGSKRPEADIQEMLLPHQEEGHADEALPRQSPRKSGLMGLSEGEWSALHDAFHDQRRCQSQDAG